MVRVGSVFRLHFGDRWRLRLGLLPGLPAVERAGLGPCMARAASRVERVVAADGGRARRAAAASAADDGGEGDRDAAAATAKKRQGR